MYIKMFFPSFIEILTYNTCKFKVCKETTDYTFGSWSAPEVRAVLWD